MAYDFPAGPVENQEFTPAGGPTYIFKAPRWLVKGVPPVDTGGIATVVIGTSPPPTPILGMLWWDSDAGRLFIYYNDGTSVQWVEAIAPPVDLAAFPTKAYVDAQIPVGTIIHTAGAVAPTNYLKCNGAAVSRATYSALYLLLGTTYGAGNGTTTFNLPDLRGEFIRGWDDGRGLDTSRVRGSAQADDFISHTHTAVAVADHTHPGSSATAGDHTHTGSTDTEAAHTHTATSDAATGGAHTPAGSISSVSAGTPAGSISTDAHNHTGTTVSAGAHTHDVRIYKNDGSTTARAAAQTDDFQTAYTATAAALSAGAHTHTFTTSSDTHGHTFTGSALAGHAHTFTGTAIAAHDHAVTTTVAAGGSHAHALTIANAGAHTHTITVSAGGAHNHTINATGGTETRPTNVALLACIKYQ